MRPDFNLIAENNSILRSSLISLRITDESGTMSDEAEICFEHGNNALELKSELEVFLGYKETGLLPMGVYVASEITIQSPPQILRVKCQAAKLRGSLKEKTSKEWKEITLGNLVREIAEKHGYEAKIAQKFEDIFIPHITQTDESDMNFLKRIGDEHEATVKSVGGYIIFIPRGEGKSATGKVLGTTLLTPKDVINWKVNFNVRSKYGSVIAKWYSYERGETIEEKVGNERPSYPIYKLYPTAESAISAASAKLRRLKRGEAKLNVTIPGNPELFAEAKINLSGFCQEIDGEWVIERAEHTLNNRGYQTMIEAVISRID
ncbi:phage late control D family protein [Wolbachia endosymbiont (group A) of Icerya purchasi]|uniref:phage late control D family protein n=1 Tax=Wolbachia endosymbiont (group A) of Icerya purchasi TaxID=2954019 RepID=UPI0022326D70|nr:contractile injection system protein, VgrG/Pvc8 family [Wolbachia endosymbiont (group A) of Icerya purchasi]